MSIREKATTDVEVNGQSAGQVLDQLKKKAEGYRDAMVQANKANDLVGYQKAQAELKKTESSMTKLKTASFEVNTVLKNLSGSTLKDLQKAKSMITKELEKMTRGTKEYIAASKNLKSVNQEIGKVKTEMQGVAGAQESWFSRASAGFNKYFGMLTAGVAAFTGVIFGVRKAIDSYNEFEKTVSNLSALTGLQGENLRWLAEQAKLLSTSTTESGVKITASAIEIVEAYKLMGSAKPELLKNKEALNEVTKSALILAEAAGIETAEAVTSLANIMNQFGAPAEEATKFINILAAGSKEGAAEVNDLSDSIVRSGAAATQANISIEQEVALIETLAEKGIKAERAGTGLRGTILKLQKGSDEFNPKVVGMSKALENLAAKNLSAKEVMELFGEESYTVAQTLITSRKRFDELTAAVTNTNVATEQAVINTDNNAAKLEQAKNKAQLMSITLGEKLAPALTFSTNSFSYMMKAMLALINLFENHGRTILALTIGIVAYTVALKAQVIWTWAVEKATKAAEFAMNLFNKTSKANWLAIIIGLLASAASAFLLFKRDIVTATKAQEDFNKAVQEGNDILTNNKTIEERYKIIGNLNKRQVLQLRDDIKSQLLAEEDLTVKLLAILKKRWDEDEQLKELQFQKNKANGKVSEAWYQRQIDLRKEELAKDLQQEQNKHTQSKKLLDKYLTDVDVMLKKMPNDSDPLNGTISDDNKKKMIDELEKAYNLRRLLIIKFNQKYNLDQEGLTQSLLANEIAYLKLKEDTLRKSGEDTTVMQAEIATKEAQLNDSIVKAKQDANLKKGQSDKEYYDAVTAQNIKLTDEQKAELAKRAQDEETAFQQKQQYYENIKSITDNLGTSLGETFGNMASDAEMTSQDFARSLLLIALDTLQAIVQMSLAEIWARQIATKGFFGIGTALVLTGLVNAAFAGVKAVVNNSMKKKSSSSGKTKQHFAGTLDATGAEDGRTYHAPYVGAVDSPTYFPNTSLISERGGELVVDSGRSRNIRMRYPQLLEAIRAVPQHASGTIGGTGGGSVAGAPSTNDPNLSLNIQQNTAVLAALYSEIKNGIAANMNFDHFNEQMSKGNSAINDVSR